MSSGTWMSRCDSLQRGGGDVRGLQPDPVGGLVVRLLLARDLCGDALQIVRHLALLALRVPAQHVGHEGGREDRKSTRLNSSHANISYAVFCLKKNITLTKTNTNQ